MPLLVVLALIVVPVVELYLIVQVGSALGVLPTLLILVALSVLGGVLLRREGARTWRAFREALAAGRLPAAEVADGALVILGGALLLTPGFATDAVGLLCVLPPTRLVLRRLLTSVVARRLGAGGLLRFAPGPRRRGPGGGGPGGSGPGGGSVVDGSVVDEAVVDGPVVDGEVVRPAPDDPTAPRR